MSVVLCLVLQSIFTHVNKVVVGSCGYSAIVSIFFCRKDLAMSISFGNLNEECLSCKKISFFVGVQTF